LGLILTRTKKVISSLLTLFLSLLILLSNSSRVTNGESTYWPTEEWQTVKPRQQDMDKDLLEELNDYIEGLSVTIDSIVVIRNGYIVQEGYFGLYEASWSHALWSVTKSFTCALIGAAIKEGFIPLMFIKKFSIIFPIEISLMLIQERKQWRFNIF